MNILRTVRIALRALGRNKMRSFLTALGIIIGVGAVIATVSIGEGAKREVEKRFEDMGTNLLTVRPGSQLFRGRSYGGGSVQSMTAEDAEAILEKCDAVQYVSPSVSGRAQVVYGNKNWNTSIYGVGDKYPEIRKWEIEEGVFFDENQVRAGQKICVLGSEVNQNLFEGAYPIGQVIRIQRIPFRVTGTLKSVGESGGFWNRDDMILVPYTTAQRRILGTTRINSIDVSAVSGSRTTEAMRQIEDLLRIRHKIAPGAEDDFNVRNMADIAESAAESRDALKILLGGIASVSLLVGGIGIMNIMLASVTERTREIGIRRAIGAKRRQIITQFLIETVVLSTIGGIVGLCLGVFIPLIITLIAGMPTVITPMSIMLPLFISVGIGILFGMYPAARAAEVDPIVALRHE